MEKKSPTQSEKPLVFCSPGLRKLLLRLELVSSEQLDRAQQDYSQFKVIAALVSSEGIEETEILQRVAADLSLQVIDLQDREIQQKMRSSDVVDALDTRSALLHRVIPLYRDDQQIVLAMADPLDTESVSELEFILDSRVKVVLAREHEIVAELNRVGGVQMYEEAAAHVVETSYAGEDICLAVDGPEDTDASMKVGSESAPVVRLVNRMLSDALILGASDVHLEPTARSLEVRFRVDGVLSTQLSLPKRLQSYIVARLKILAGMDITERRRPQDGRFRFRAEGGSKGDTRVSSVPTPFGEKIVLRLLRADLAGLSLDSLGLSPEIQEEFIEALRARDRIVVVTGPTGSGKSTTLYAGITYLKGSSTNIITVEDPIEYRINGITQIQVDEKVGMTFASGLRSILRQDPDIIMVGEIRDLETAEISFQAAQTGHLVLSTLHTNTAISAVVRLFDLGLEPFIVASSLGAVVAQRLVRRLCESCKRMINDEEAQELFRKYGIASEAACMPVGCQECEDSGYRGRVGLYSFLSVGKEVRDLIRDGASEDAIELVAKENGMMTMFESGCRVVEQGLSTIDEVERVIGSAQSMERMDSDRGLEFVGVSDVQQTEITTVDDLCASFLAGPEQELNALQSEGNAEDLSEKLHEGNNLASKSIANLASAYRELESSDSERTKVLVVDDDKGIRAVLVRAFRKADFQVCEAANGFEALDKLNDFAADVIVSDLIMPGMDGEEFVSQVRLDKKKGKIPILILTGSDNEANEIRLIESGADDFVSKVSSPAVIITRTKRLLEK